MGIIIFLIGFIFNKSNSSGTSVKYSMEYFPSWYIISLYLLGTYAMIYIFIKTIFVIKKKGSFMKFMFKNTKNESDNFQHQIVAIFISRHLLFCYVFIGLYLPNHFIILLQSFSKEKICNNCSSFSFGIYLISLSCTVDFCIKVTEPYMKKYISLLLSTIFRKKEEVINDNDENNEDYNVLYGNDGDKFNDEIIINDDSPQINLNEQLVPNKIIQKSKSKDDLHNSLLKSSLIKKKIIRFEMKEIDQGKKLN
jgi:hypothetical protein